ncbi:GTP-binding protein [Plasmodium gonderi]|uniref:GTP-binding protein n=1 Tax=Plasmodium gonderi TaxID=77519 RepID=A0A1Y1JFX7_PLAGO|nr:GTP-binding protein [Plasmodium gonderi]GAW79662.1 GTP-binding protein [Plasmodium gonderi]
MFHFKLLTHVHKKLNFFNSPKREFIYFLLKNERIPRLSIYTKSKCTIHSYPPNVTSFISLSDTDVNKCNLGWKNNKHAAIHTLEEIKVYHNDVNLEAQENNGVNDEAYENNECVYIQSENKFVVSRRKREKYTGNSKKKETIIVDTPPMNKQNENRFEGHVIMSPGLSIACRSNNVHLDYTEELNDLNTPSKECIEHKTENELPKDPSIGEVVATMRNEALMKILTEPNDHMMIRNEKRFCDFLWVVAKSGKGGNPNYKRQRSKKLKGEGYGGHGGNVILKSKKSIYDLIKIEQKVKANDGENFKENSRGKDGKDKIIFVPVGTIVRKRIYCQKKNENNRKIYKSIFWYQFLKENEELLVARGGKGGISYSFFKKHDFRLPENGEKTLLELELRLLNDVAFIGIENSGKTSLCSSLSKYYGNISTHMFTTTIPHVSNINYIDGVEITLLDTPFLFHNAHRDKTRGKRILRHLYRSKLIVYVIDVSSDKLENVDDLQIEDYYLENLKRKNNYQENTREEDDMDEEEEKKESREKKKRKMETHGHLHREGNADNKGTPDMHKADDINTNLKNYYNDTIKQIKMLRNELFLFNPEYLKKKELVVATKCDMLHKNTLLNLDSLYFRLKNFLPHIEVIGTSAKFGLGIKLLSRKIRELIYPQYILQNHKLYAKNIEDYVIPTYNHFKEGKMKLQNYELSENVKHIYDHNYMENFDYFLKNENRKRTHQKHHHEKQQQQQKDPSIRIPKDETFLLAEKSSVRDEGMA